MLFALAIALSWLESMVSPLGLMPAIKLGLSNIVVMYAVVPCAPARGGIAGGAQGTVCLSDARRDRWFLSLCGGALALAVYLLLLHLPGVSGYYSAPVGRWRTTSAS